MAEIVAGVNTAIDDSVPGVLKIDALKGVVLRQLLIWNGSGYPAKNALVPNAVYQGPVNPDGLAGSGWVVGDSWENTVPVVDADPDKRVIVSANVAAPSTTFVDSGLSMAVKAGVTYEIAYVLHFNASAATIGARYNFTGPAFTLFAGRMATGPAANALTVWNFGNTYTMGTPGNTNILAAAATVLGDFTFTPSADGTLMLQFAPNTAGTLTLLPGSRLKYRALPVP